MVDADNLEEHQVHVKENLLFQNWSSLFLEFCGPVYPDLVKELWVHAFVIPKAIVSFVHGRFFSIAENTFRMLFDLMNAEGETEATLRTNWDAVYTEIFTDGNKSTRVKDLKN